MIRYCPSERESYLFSLLDLAIGVIQGMHGIPPLQVGETLPSRVADLERALIAEAFTATGSLARAAQRLGIPRSTLHEKMARLQMQITRRSEAVA